MVCIFQHADLPPSPGSSSSKDLLHSTPNSSINSFHCEDGDLDLDGIDDEEINGYLMNSQEVQRKTLLWEKLNSDYINQQKSMKKIQIIKFAIYSKKTLVL